MNITKEIAVYIAQKKFYDIPQDTLRMGKLCFLDWLGVTIAGAKSEVGSVAQNYLSLFSNEGPATIIGFNKKSNLTSASLVNGMMSHALDFDDYHMSTILHTTAPSLPAILATAEYIQWITVRIVLPEGKSVNPQLAWTFVGLNQITIEIDGIYVGSNVGC